MEELARDVLPPGIGFEWTELAFQQQQPGTPTLLVFGAAALFVFLVLAAWYNNWKLPLSVVMIVPMNSSFLPGCAYMRRDRNRLRYSGNELPADPKEYFLQIHDPTTRNRQGNDIGTATVRRSSIRATSRETWRRRRSPT